MRPIACLLLTLPALGQGFTPRADFESGRFLKALGDAEAQLRSDPGNALAWAAKSQALSALLRWPEALAAADRAVALRPDLADALLARGIARAGTAVAQRNLGSLRGVGRAMDDFRAATQADPTLGRAWMSLGLGYQQLPGILGGSTRKALACAGSLRQVSGPKGDLLEGLVRSMDGDWKGAEPCFQRALAAAPGDPEVVTGWLEQLDGRAAGKALGAEGQRAWLRSEAARLLPQVQRRAKGVEAVSEAYLSAGLPEEAWRAAEAGLHQVEAPSILRLQLGKVAARSGRHQLEGLAYLDQVLREPLEGGSGGLPAAHWRRGQILRDLGRKEEARSEARRALDLDAHHQGALKLLESLGG
ncbi:MAG TPA: tetratricopeptide repeat protein [Holophagaceae bacterium]|nr:tetratricopeptide repeat protein [Holophagaceae bacterium]